MRSGKDPIEQYSSGTALATNYFGNNLGNLVFTNATHWLLTTSKQETISNHLRVRPSEADWINDNFDAFVIPLANAFRPSFKGALQRLTELISQLKIPVMVLGVGAQLSLKNDFSRLQAMDAEVKNFMNVVLERSASVGVRGEATKNYLSSLGYSNTEVFGCPSMFIDREYLNVQANDSIAELHEDSKIALTFSPYVRKGEAIVEKSFKEFRNLDYFAQDIYTMRTIVSGEPLNHEGDFPGIPNYFNHPLLQSERTKFHTDPISWMNDLQNYDFSFGTRIHGTIAALTSGVPATLIAHDSRTSELAEYFGIPYIRATDLKPETSAKDLAEIWDSKVLVSGHAQRFSNISNFIKENGFEVATRDEMQSSVAAAKSQKAINVSPVISNSRQARRLRRLSLRDRVEIARFMAKTPKPKNICYLFFENLLV
jgi:polysaccharide pyruvyl transferase WcaK-like protein